jgi:hypothetical protein
MFQSADLLAQMSRIYAGKGFRARLYAALLPNSTGC